MTSEKANRTASFAMVITLSEACRTWYLTRNAIIYRHWQGDLVLRKSGDTWLVYVPDMLRVYGEPPGWPDFIVDSSIDLAAP